MKNFVRGLSLLLLVLSFFAAPILADDADPGNTQADDQACWGQASQVFAKTGEMGFHSAAQDTPRLGLRNLARLLYDAGLIEDDSIQTLGAFVSVDVSACQ